MKLFLSLNNSWLLSWVVLFVLINSVSVAAAANKKNTTRDDQIEITVSLYQHDLAFIRDTRSISLDSGRNHLIWQEISANIIPETAWLRHLTHPDRFQIATQSFDLQLLTPQKLLESYTGKSITVIQTNPATGEENREAATVLTTQGGIVLKFADRIETGVPGRLAFPEIPDNLRDTPSMLALIDYLAADGNDQHELQLAYLTQGLSWRADYILELDQHNRIANLVGLATLTNQSGIDYPNARLQLIAGDINQTRIVRKPTAKRMNLTAESASAPQSAMDTEPHFELHRYHLHEATSLLNDQSKQVTFMSANKFPVEKEFILQGQSHYYLSYHPPQPEQKQPIDVYIQFSNTGDPNIGLGVPLPAGVIRAYQHDRHGESHFIGEDTIRHTPDKALVQLKLGHAFDISAEKKQTDYKKIPTADKSARLFESAFQINLHNAKKVAVTVVVREPIPGDWTMLTDSVSHKKIASNLAEWEVKIPAEGSAELTYRVRVAL